MAKGQKRGNREVNKTKTAVRSERQAPLPRDTSVRPSPTRGAGK
jgi:hypothetical protein